MTDLGPRSQKLLREVLGKRFGRLIVLEAAGTNYEGRLVVRCVCDCAKEKLAVVSQLKDGRTNSCGCLRQEIAAAKSVVAVQSMVDKGLWTLDPSISVAKKIWHKHYADGDLSFDEFWNLSQQDCFYCGRSPSNRTAPRIRYRNGALIVPVESDYFTYNGLDRVDSNGLHTLDNIVPCCCNCNYAKSDSTQAEFFEWVKRTYEKNFQE